MRRRACVIPACAALLLSAPCVRAGDLPAVPPGTETAPLVASQKPVMLADALAAFRLPKGQTLIAVGADVARLPEDAPASDPGDTPEQVAAAYGKIAQDFHRLTAVAAPSMTLLTDDPGMPNPYAGLPPGDVLKLLLGGLNAAQWKKLTGPDGIGAADLTGPSQASLFAALFPGDHAQAFPLPNASLPDGIWRPIDISRDDLLHSRIRLAQTTTLALPLAGRRSEYQPSNTIVPSVQYRISSPTVSDEDRATVGGVRLRSTVPNRARAGDLDWDRIEAARVVSLEGVQTVKDLVARIGKAAGLELYADRRYEIRSVTYAGAPDVPAPDLLRTLSLCLSATFRKVGPAYVLTPDKAGLGAHRTALYRFAAELQMSRAGAIAAAGDHLITAHGLAGIADISGMGMTGAQRAKAVSQGYMPGGAVSATLPFSELTPDQQAQARKMASESYQAGATRLSLEGNVVVSTQPTLLLTVPSVPGPVQADPAFPTAGLLTPSSRLSKPAGHDPSRNREPTPTGDLSANEAAELKSVLARYPRRAVRAHPKTEAELTSLIASMKALGMNALFLDVFSGGTAHTLVKSPSEPNGLLRTDTDTDILGAAIAKASSAGIAVFPMFDLLTWGDDTPKEARDLTILGESSDQAAAWRSVYASVLWHGMTVDEARAAAPHEATWVSPDADAVRSGLLPFLHDIAQTLGIAGVVLRDTAAPGYEHTVPGNVSWTYSELGYTLPLRLAFLRAEHTDPLDLQSEAGDGGMEIDLSIPEFDAGELMNPVQSAWNTTRGKANADLMSATYRQIAPSPQHPPEIWVAQRLAHARSSWFGLWPRDDAPLPMLSDELQYNPDTNTNFAAFAHTQSPLALGIVHADNDIDDTALIGKLKALKSGWDGVLLDFGNAPGDPLKAFAKRQKGSGAVGVAPEAGTN